MSLLYRNQPDYDCFDQTQAMEDLRIDAVIDAVIDFSGTEERTYLRDYYRQKPRNPEDVRHRLAVVSDLHAPALREGLMVFIQAYNRYKRYQAYAETASDADMAAKFRLDAASAYIDGLLTLNDTLNRTDYTAEAFRRFHEELTAYLQSDEFVSLKKDADRVNAEAEAAFRYILEVRPFERAVYIRYDADAGAIPRETGDYFENMRTVFARYHCGAFDTPVNAFSDNQPNQLEALIMERVKKARPALFASVRAFKKECAATFIDEFEREIHFYLAYMAYQTHMEERGYYFSLPVMTDDAMVLTAGYDLTLAQRGMAVVPNDFTAQHRETHFILTGPNQGGKTTFARMLGQCLYFAHLGLPVPCRSFTFRFYSRLLTHFIRPEIAGSNLGRLKEELVRLRGLFDAVQGAASLASRENAATFCIVNELFSSATSYDARLMGNAVLDRLSRAGCVCLYVTHIFELAGDAPGRVSMVAGMDDTQKQRTFTVKRRPADGKAYANGLMDKHRLYRRDIEKRMAEVATNNEIITTH